MERMNVEAEEAATTMPEIKTGLGLNETGPTASTHVIETTVDERIGMVQSVGFMIGTWTIHPGAATLHINCH